MDKSKNYLDLKKFCLRQGLDLFGVADVGSIKSDFSFSQRLLERFERAVSLGVRLSCGVLQDIVQAPTKLYFHHYRTANALLDQAALKIGNHIQGKGYLALPVPASQILDWQNQTAHLSHKKIGHLAGLGWIGRNNLLVNRRFGCQFRLVTVLTDMPLKTDKPVEQDCKDCRLCIAACPVQAVKEGPGDFDHIACFEKLKDFQKQRLVDQYICGICVSVCRGR